MARRRAPPETPLEYQHAMVSEVLGIWSTALKFVARVMVTAAVLAIWSFRNTCTMVLPSADDTICRLPAMAIFKPVTGEMADQPPVPSSARHRTWPWTRPVICI